MTGDELRCSGRVSNPLITGDELRCSGRVSNPLITGDELRGVLGMNSGVQGGYWG